MPGPDSRYALVANRPQNVKTALVDASDVITGHRKIVKKSKKSKVILTKFSDRKTVH